MVNVDLLKIKLSERGLNVQSLAKMMGKDRATIYRKLNSDGEGFSIKEADVIARLLNLSCEDATNIFFSQYVA